MGRIWVGALIGAISMATPDCAWASDDVIVLQPGSQWMLDAAAERCTLGRQFGTAENPIWLRLDSYGATRSYWAMVWGKDAPWSSGPFGRLAYRLTPDDDLYWTTAGQGKMGEANARFFNTNLGPSDREDMEDEAAEWDSITPEQWQTVRASRAASRAAIIAFQKRVENIEIHLGERTFDLRTGPMEKPLAALALCALDLQRYWGLDIDQQQTLMRPAAPKEGAIRRMQNSYPARQLIAGSSAHVPVRIMVGADGVVTQCVIQIDGVEEGFRKSVCDNLSGTYQPALDSNGQPVASAFLTSVTYRIR